MTQTSLEDIAVPPSRQALAEAQVLAGEILRDIELSQIPLSLVVLKTLRLARIVNDFEAQQIFEWESGGYPQEAKGVTREVWAAAVKANRVYFWSKSSNEERTQRMYRDSIEELENYKEIGSIGLQAADHPVERRQLRSNILTRSARLASRRTFIYSYASRKYYELNFGGVANDAFGRIRSSVDTLIGKAIPESVRKFTAIYDNLKSDNPEDWANAVHGCRRVLQDLADAVFPAQVEPRYVEDDGEAKPIKLGNDQYINRLIAYIDHSSKSERFNELVGSELNYIGNRLDALFKASQKGSHATVSKEEADRYVVYTYLMVGDILSLRNPLPSAEESYIEETIDSEFSEVYLGTPTDVESPVVVPENLSPFVDGQIDGP